MRVSLHTGVIRMVLGAKSVVTFDSGKIELAGNTSAELSKQPRCGHAANRRVAHQQVDMQRATRGWFSTDSHHKLMRKLFQFAVDHTVLVASRA